MENINLLHLHTYFLFPFAMNSAKVMAEKARAAFEAGAMGYLPKANVTHDLVPAVMTKRSCASG